jgi:hypothetical protein
MANTYELIQTTTVGSGGASTIDFTSISATYKDLCLKYSLRTSAAGTNDGGFVIFNNDSGANYSRKQLYGTGSVVASDGATGLTYVQLGPINGSGSTANTFSIGELYIPNYVSTTAEKSTSGFGAHESNNTLAYLAIGTTLWNPATQAAINQITLSTGSGMLQYSTASLYGIKNT